MILHQRGERRKRRAVTVEVRAQGEDYDRLRILLGGVREQLDEPAALFLVAAEREDLLRLVDDENELCVGRVIQKQLAHCETEVVRLAAQVREDRARRDAALGRHAHGQLLEWMRARGHDHDLPVATRTEAVDATPDRGDEPGAHDGRLAAARRADNGEERRSGKPLREVLDELLATEEELRVLGLEGLESLVRCAHLAAKGRVVGGLLVERARRRKVVLHAVDHELEQLLRPVEVLEQMLSHVAQVDAVELFRLRDGARRPRDEYLAAVRGRADTCREMQPEPEVALLLDAWLARVQSHPNA